MRLGSTCADESPVVDKTEIMMQREKKTKNISSILSNAIYCLVYLPDCRHVYDI